MPLGAALARNNIAGEHALAAENLQPEPLAIGVAAVAGGAACFLVSHNKCPSVVCYITQHRDEIITSPGCLAEKLAAGLDLGGLTRRRCTLGRGFALTAWPRRRVLVGLRPVGQDLGDPDQGELLAVATLAARILAPALLEGDHLRPAALVQHLA